MITRIQMMHSQRVGRSMPSAKDEAKWQASVRHGAKSFLNGVFEAYTTLDQVSMAQRT